MNRSKVVAVGAGLILSALCAPAAAQTSLQRLEFSFANPGARSMGFGGAFVALADDPTAAFANPGGLVQLARPEVFLDVRLDLESKEESPTFSFENDSTEATNLSFLSLVYPISRCSLAAYGHQTVKADIESLNQDSESGGVLDLDITRYAIAGACRVSDSFSIGVGVSYFDSIFRVEEVIEESSGWGLNAGVLWHATGTFSVGAFYREGPELEIDGGSGGVLALPDAYGLGAAIRSNNGRFTVSAEWDRVTWSTMFRGVGASVLGPDPVVLVDADEYHLGFEYAWNTTSKVVALRLGGWRDPDYVAERPGGEEGRTRYHAAAGIGFAWKHFQLDVATDISSDVFTLGVSGMYTF